MGINDIAEDIIKKEDNMLARAFTMVMGNVLIENGIKPVASRTVTEFSEDDTKYSYMIRREYNVTFDIDTTEHDKKVRAEAFDEFAEILIKRCRSKLGDLEYVSEDEICRLRDNLLALHCTRKGVE